MGTHRPWKWRCRPSALLEVLSRSMRPTRPDWTRARPVLGLDRRGFRADRRRLGVLAHARARAQDGGVGTDRPGLAEHPSGCLPALGPLFQDLVGRLPGRHCDQCVHSGASRNRGHDRHLPNKHPRIIGCRGHVGDGHPIALLHGRERRDGDPGSDLPSAHRLEGVAVRRDRRLPRRAPSPDRLGRVGFPRRPPPALAQAETAAGEDLAPAESV